MSKHYDLWLVLLSFTVASMAAYVALHLTSRVSAARGQRPSQYWLAGGALSMGVGIWAMHFIGMLALSLPIPIGYDAGVTLASLAIAVAVSAFALFIASGSLLGWRRLAGAGVLMGLGIVAMHYTGMAALRLRPGPAYDPVGVAASVAVAIAASVAALWLSFHLRRDTLAGAFRRRIGGALVMGAAIAGMHYTGMAASQFSTNTICYAGAGQLNNGWLAYTVGLCTALFLVVTLVISVFDARLAERTARISAESERIKQAAEQALHKEREFLKALLESLSDGIVACDGNGILTVFNRATREFHGLPEEPLPADLWADRYSLFLADGKTRMSRDQVPLFRALSGETLRDAEFVIAPQNRPPRSMQCNGQPIINPSGEKLGAVIAMHDVTERKRYESSLAFQARNDALTGLPNRLAFEEALQQCLAATTDNGESHFLLYIDLDHFKIVNDTSGHAAGDRMLREVGALLRSHLRPSDFIARIGGDEFAVLLYVSSAAAARKVAENLLQAIRDYQLTYEGRTFRAGLSVGITEIRHGNTDASAVMAQADTACYAAKDLGRCRSQFYNIDDAQILLTQRNMHWVQRIEHALDHHRFEVHLQKIVDRERSTVGYEALIRMRSEDSGPCIGPDAFLPAAKRMGLMVRIDQWMAREVLELVYRRKAAAVPGAPCYISINLSAKSAGDPAFVDWMLALIDQYSIGKDLLRFEITETEQLQATDTESRLIAELRRRGFKVWLDDFGMGYNSFDLLKRLPVDGLKIDRSFTSDLMRDPVDRALVEAIVSLGKAMKLDLLAEGVEDPTALEELCGMGAHYFQGHLFERAGPAAQAMA
jgi:diguanylate cyclase (GGDEF)-like protein/PAS domain S-box-containing protein